MNHWFLGPTLKTQWSVLLRPGRAGRYRSRSSLSLIELAKSGKRKKVGNKTLSSWKPNMTLEKVTIFNRKYISKWWIYTISPKNLLGIPSRPVFFPFQDHCYCFSKGFQLTNSGDSYLHTPENECPLKRAYFNRNYFWTKNSGDIRSFSGGWPWLLLTSSSKNGAVVVFFWNRGSERFFFNE